MTTTGTTASEIEAMTERVSKATITTDEEKDKDEEIEGIEFVNYEDESQLEAVMTLVGQDLSEPYSSKSAVLRSLRWKSPKDLFCLLPFFSSVFTFRYFLLRFPSLCILAVSKDSDSRQPIGCVVGKVDDEEIFQNGETKIVPTGYIGMLAVSKEYRRKGIGRALVQRVVKRMKKMECTSVTLETEVSNVTAQKLYQDAFGFVREELLVRYYLNFGDAYRLRLWFG